jgi:Na+/proline symporter
MAWMPLVTVFVVMLVGISALPLLSGLGEIGADEVMPRVIRLWSFEGGGAILLATLVFMGALAAIMSTADSVLLSLGSVITEDILGGDRYDPRTTRRGKWIGAGLLLAMVLIAIIPRITLWRLIELKMEILMQCAPAFILGAHWPRVGARALILGILGGCAVALWGMWSGTPRLAGFHAGVIGLGLNFLLVAGMTLLGGRREETPGAEG